MPGQPRGRYLLLAGLASSIAAGPALGVSAGTGQAGAEQTAVTRALPNVPIKHVIEIMIENHAFDNLFGRFPGADGIPPNTSLPNPNAHFDSAPNVSPVWRHPTRATSRGPSITARPPK